MAKNSLVTEVTFKHTQPTYLRYILMTLENVISSLDCLNVMPL